MFPSCTELLWSDWGDGRRHRLVASSSDTRGLPSTRRGGRQLGERGACWQRAAMVRSQSLAPAFRIKKVVFFSWVFFFLFQNPLAHF